MNDRLQKFARLVEIGSFTKAARELHISQPALTIAVNKLEQELGAELLVRSNRKFELTEAGEAAYRAAREHQVVTDQLQTSLRSIARMRPAVSIGMTDSVAAILCDTAAFEELESAADVTIVVNNSRYLREAVEHRQLDVAYIIDDGAEHAAVQSTAAGTETLLLVCHPDIISQTENNLRQGKLNDFVCYDKPSTTYRHIQTKLHSLHIHPHATLFSTSPDVMLRMVLRGKGTAVLPQLSVLQPVEVGELATPLLDNKPVSVSRPVCRVQLPGRTLPACLKQFCAVAQIS